MSISNMYIKRKYFVFLGILFFSAMLHAQEGKIVHRTTLNNQTTTIELKWYSQQFMYKNGIDVFRKEENKDWQKLNTLPIKKKNTAPETKDENLKMAYDVARTQESFDGVILLNLLLESFRAVEFADYVGIYFEDKNVTNGSKYKYQIKHSDSGVIIAESDFIDAGKPTTNLPPENIEYKHKRKDFTKERGC